MTDGEGSRRRVSRLFVWGCGEDYQLGLARATRELDFAVHQPTEIPRESFFDDDTGVNDVNDDDFGTREIERVVAGSRNSCVVTSAKELFSWFENEPKMCCDNNTTGGGERRESRE